LLSVSELVSTHLLERKKISDKSRAGKGNI